MAHNMYEVGTKAWQPDATEGWVSSEVEERIVTGDKLKLVFRLENGEVRETSHYDPPWHGASSAILRLTRRNNRQRQLIPRSLRW